MLFRAEDGDLPIGGLSVAEPKPDELWDRFPHMIAKGCYGSPPPLINSEGAIRRDPAAHKTR